MRARWWAVVVLVALGLGLSSMGLGLRPMPLQAPLASLPKRMGPWQALGPDGVLEPRVLKMLMPTDYLVRNYADSKGRICSLMIIYFDLQHQGRMIHSPSLCLPGSGWVISSRETVAVPTAEGARVVNHLLLVRGLERLSVLYWFQGRGKVEHNEYRRRWQLLLSALESGRTDEALVRIISPLWGDVGGVVEAQVDFAARVIPALDKLLAPGQAQQE